MPALIEDARAKVNLTLRVVGRRVDGYHELESLVVFAGCGDTSFHAIDTATGKDLWAWPLGRRTTSTPSTYRTRGGRQFVVIATGQGAEAVLVAFCLTH